ncbi:hypothetical protein [Eubacterium sp. 1001713B170207_170306_E7]|uniref:hypothetical protein n=1 Tax=Eubacterium sp. 1001713B170207_170306_E7 TaxID=2787097 RepID=UPI00189AE7A1|nr:hypothetical protein [Eubacterium sp. 1001713B170207_170306_E7]
MILYICGNKKNAHDMDFLSDFDKVDCKIASEFSVRGFLDEANTYVNLEYLILDIMVVHDTQEELINSLINLHTFCGTIPVVYLPSSNDKDLSGTLAEIKERGIDVFNKRDYKEQLTKIINTHYMKVTHSVQESVDLKLMNTALNKKNKEGFLTPKDQIIIDKLRRTILYEAQNE